MRELWTTISPVLSTAHLKPQTMQTLDLYRNLIAKYDHGCFVFIGDSDEDLSEFPEDLQEVARWLWVQPGELTWVRFDSDGDVVDELPRYPW